MSSYTIAIVDDSDSDRYICKRHLQSVLEDSLFLEFENGKEALKFMVEDGPKGINIPPDAYPPDVIMLDINMPLMDGHEFLDALEKEISGDDRLATVIIMMLSSSSREDDINRAMAHPIVKDYLVKGQFTADEISEKIKTYLAAE